MFTGQPVKYYGNFALRMKLALIVLAGVNMLVFRFVTCRWGRGMGRRPDSTRRTARRCGFAHLLDYSGRLRQLDRVLYVLIG
jgi:hypothetical protein